MPSKALHKGIWTNTTEFPVSVPLTRLGTLLDCLVGRDSWKKGGLEAFSDFWKDNQYDIWKETAAAMVWEAW
jgi:hypothetical protein